MITISIVGIVKFICFILLAFVFHKFIQVISQALKYERLVDDWVGNEEKLKIYNKFKEYIETDIITGLRKPIGGLVGDIPVVECRRDYENLGEREQNVVKAVLKHLDEIPDLEEFDKQMTEYLNTAADIKKLRGF
jgi:hypothetical protein